MSVTGFTAEVVLSHPSLLATASLATYVSSPLVYEWPSTQSIQMRCGVDAQQSEAVLASRYRYRVPVAPHRHLHSAKPSELPGEQRNRRLCAPRPVALIARRRTRDVGEQ